MSLRPGTELSLHWLNALSERARRGSTVAAGNGLTAQDSPGGMVFAKDPAPESLPDCRRMSYNSAVPGMSLPPGSLIHILDPLAVTQPVAELEMAGDPAPGIFQLCEVTGRMRLGVLVEGAVPQSTPGWLDGSCPMVQYQGIAQVLWDFTSIPRWYDATGGPGFNGNSPIMSRLGARSGSPFAVWDDNGPLMILDDAGPVSNADCDLIFRGGLTPAVMVVPPGDLSPYGTLHIARVAMLLNRFADEVYCVQPGIGGDGFWIRAPYNCFHFGPNYSVGSSDIANGDILVEM